MISFCRFPARRFHFESSEQRTFAGILYTGLVLPTGQEKADAEFFFWSGDLKGYLPDCSRERGVWSAGDRTGFLKIVSSCGMTGGDFTRNRYYSCLEKEPGREEMPACRTPSDLCSDGRFSPACSCSTGWPWGETERAF